MKAKPFDKNLPVEKRISKLETVTERLMRRAPYSATALITPFPISNAVFGEDVNGVILRYLFPCEGVVNKGMVQLGTKPKSPIRVLIRAVGPVVGTTREYLVEKDSLIIEPGLGVQAGTRLEVTLINLDQENQVTEVWISLLWTPSVSDISRQSFIIDEVENDLLEE